MSPPAPAYGPAALDAPAPPCPLCLARGSTPIRSYNLSRLAAAWRDHLHIDITPELPPEPTTTLFTCAGCGLGFFHPAKPGSGAFYADLQAFPWYYPKFKWEHAQALTEVRPGQQILEVGSGTGEFLARLVQTVPTAEGIELSDAAVEAATQRGLKVRNITLADLARTGQRYDAVMAFQVLEHVPDPRGFLVECAAVLSDAPGSRLILGVPNADAYHRHVLDPFDLPPHHMTRWTPSAFRAVAKLLGLQLDRLAAAPLEAEHAFQWASSLLGRATGRLVDVTDPAGLPVRALSKLARTTGLRRLLPGHTLYASLSRPGAAPRSTAV